MRSMNKTIGFVKSHKPFEQRLALLPIDIMDIKHKEYIYIEQGYGSDYGIVDEEYLQAGVHIDSRKKVLTCDIICDPKIGEATFLEELSDHTTLFGWIHAVEHPELTAQLVRKGFHCYAWEDLHYNHRHVFYKNNVLAGESAVLHAIQCHGMMPKGKEVAIIGRGNTAMGANYIIQSLGGNVRFYNRFMEDALRKDLPQFDIVINAVLWDPARTDHILYHEDLKRMKQDALIIDVSDDVNGAIEDAQSTQRDLPTYEMDGITIYAVNNTPSTFYRTATTAISPLVAGFTDALITGDDSELIECKIISAGVINDKKILAYQNKK